GMRAIPLPRRRFQLIHIGLWLLVCGLLLLPSRSAATPRSTLADLPLPAQAAISGALGQDSPAYHATPHGTTVRVENPRHDLTATFRPTGLHLHVGAATWGLRYQGVGYGTATRRARPVAPQAQANRIEYHHGPLTEWYVNGPRGLQQGFTLTTPPGPRTGAPLTLRLALSGSLHAHVEPGGTALTLTQLNESTRLAYRGLTAWDATGRALPARLQLQGRALLLQVEDADARYPVVVDPFIEHELAKLTTSDGAVGDAFGYSVAISGDTVVVGALQVDISGQTQQGAAYVFVKPSGGWKNTSTFTAKLTTLDGVANDNFGISVAISGDTVVVGALQVGIGGNTNQGAAYVFVKPGSGWTNTSTFTAKLTASDGAASDNFGYSVAIDGDTVVVGVPYADIGSNADQGAAYVFVKPSGGWAGALTETAKLIAAYGAANDKFGISVAIDGDTVVVGVPYADIGSNADQGAAYVFVKPGSGWANTSTFTAKLTASDGAAGDNFGSSVAISGDTVVVGAAWAAISANAWQGAAYVFVKPGGGWMWGRFETAKLIASDGAASDSFGYSVAISGNTVVGGADRATIGGRIVQGAAYVFNADSTPDPFTFTDVTGVPLSTVQTSNAITVSGLSIPAPISVAGGAYEVNGSGLWIISGSDLMVFNGDTVRVRHTSAATYSTAVNTTLTIGGVSDTFTSTTLNPPSVTLTVTVRGSASRTVTSSPTGINCSTASTCIASYASGTAVTLTANPGVGATFKQWGGACSGTATTCSLTLTANQSVTATFSRVFTDPTLTAGSTLIKAIHVTELRSAINTLRAVNGLAAFAWTDATLTVGTTPAKKVHLDELRTALGQAYQAAGQAAPSYTDPTLVAGSTRIKASHISDLRAAVRVLE
ncbi:MAG: FG-GAP repeat protein, partial [candidate division NC10 bacterium]|nr:FG-GAP repeat protein [candidate division NC10 bacterium]